MKRARWPPWNLMKDLNLKPSNMAKMAKVAKVVGAGGVGSLMDDHSMERSAPYSTKPSLRATERDARLSHEVL